MKQLKNVTSKSRKVTEKIMVKVDDPIDFFNKSRKNLLWSNHETDWKYHFRIQLKVLKLFIDQDASEKHRASFVYRLGLGYWGLGRQAGLSSGIISEKAATNPDVKTTNDHVIGAQLIGKTVHEAFVSCNFNEEYMVNAWLMENLWMWMTIQVTQEEHRSISKTVDNLDHKKAMLHYQNVSRLVTLQKAA